MRKLAHALTVLLASLWTLQLAACSTPTTDETKATISAAAVATSIGHIRPSAKDTCDTQMQVAAQSSRITTLTTGKEQVYKPAPHCDPAKAKPRSAPAPPKTSSRPLHPETEWHRDWGTPMPARRAVPEVDADRARRTS